MPCLPCLHAPQACPKRILKVFFDPGGQTVFLSLCTLLDPRVLVKEDEAAGLRKALHYQDLCEQIGLLLLFMLSDLVLMVNEGAELGISWLSKLRACQKSWRLLLRSCMTSAKDKDPGPTPITDPKPTSAAASDSDGLAKIIMGLSKRRRPLLLLTCQTHRMSAQSANRLNSMARELIRRICTSDQQKLAPSKSQRKPDLETTCAAEPMFELHDSVTALAVPPMQPNPAANLCALLDLLPAAAKAEDNGTCLLDDARCFGIPPSEAETVAAEGMQRLRAILDARCMELQQSIRASDGRAGGSEESHSSSPSSVEAVTGTWSRLWPVLEDAWRTAQEHDLQRPSLAGPYTSDAALSTTARGPRPSQTATSWMGADDDDDDSGSGGPLDDLESGGVEKTLLGVVKEGVGGMEDKGIDSKCWL